MSHTKEISLTRQAAALLLIAEAIDEVIKDTDEPIVIADRMALAVNERGEVINAEDPILDWIDAAIPLGVEDVKIEIVGERVWVGDVSLYLPEILRYVPDEFIEARNMAESMDEDRAREDF